VDVFALTILLIVKNGFPGFILVGFAVIFVGSFVGIVLVNINNRIY